MRRWRGAACTYQHEATGETKRLRTWVGADPKIHRSNDRVLVSSGQLSICDCLRTSLIPARGRSRARRGAGRAGRDVEACRTSNRCRPSYRAAARTQWAIAKCRSEQYGARCVVAPLPVLQFWNCFLGWVGSPLYLRDEKQSRHLPQESSRRVSENPFRDFARILHSRFYSFGSRSNNACFLVQRWI